ncbi:MAG: hypothetical protein ACRCSM_11080 [Sediminibacterium sp.]|nr:hypothetical protein [Chitinophagaceae bacterium]MCA6445568.1 hypothetical protein [Chitinophagaceae bacterium]
MNRQLLWRTIFVDLSVRGFEKIEELDGGWSTRYIDKKTGKEWLKYPVDPERGIQYSLIPYNPLLTTVQLLDIAFTSNYSDEVKAASHRLFHEEFYDKKESRRLILARLKNEIGNPLTTKQKDRYINIIRGARLVDKVNHREIVGKHYTEIANDAKYYQETANEAQEMLNFLTR